MAFSKIPEKGPSLGAENRPHSWAWQWGGRDRGLSMASLKTLTLIQCIIGSLRWGGIDESGV